MGLAQPAPRPGAAAAARAVARVTGTGLCRWWTALAPATMPATKGWTCPRPVTSSEFPVPSNVAGLARLKSLRMRPAPPGARGPRRARPLCWVAALGCWEGREARTWVLRSLRPRSPRSHPSQPLGPSPRPEVRERRHRRRPQVCHCPPSPRSVTPALVRRQRRSGAPERTRLAPGSWRLLLMGRLRGPRRVEGRLGEKKTKRRSRGPAGRGGARPEKMPGRRVPTARQGPGSRAGAARPPAAGGGRGRGGQLHPVVQTPMPPTCLELQRRVAAARRQRHLLQLRLQPLATRQAPVGEEQRQPPPTGLARRRLGARPAIGATARSAGT